MDPVTDQDIEQEGLIVNEDGSVDIPDDVAALPEQGFYDNLAEILPESELVSLAFELVESVERDRKAREKRDKQYEEGLKRTGLGDDAPGGAEFDGASDVVHPALAEACVDFCARAMKEIFPPQGPVKTAVIGPAPEQQLDRAERKRTYLNWQLTTQMPEYRSELEQLLTQLPLGGSQFQKFWYDERFERPVSEFVPIDDVLLPYSATSFYTAQRVTHVQHVTQFEFEKRLRSGLYRDLADVKIAPGTLPEQTATAIANDKIEGKEEDAYNEDGLRDIYEIYCWQKLDDTQTLSLAADEDDDDEPENEFAPYIITIDAYSEKILAIYRNWAEGDDSFEKQDWFVEWKFIPWRGAYAIGFPQLIGSLAAAATGSLRALLDAAHINNSQTLLKLKGSRLVGQNISVDTTGVTEIDGPAGVDDIRKLLMAIPYNPPSPILFQLLGWLTDAAKGVVKTTEGAIANVGDRTPVGTTQAMIEQGSAIYSAIHARLHESQKKALQILCRINKTWLNEEVEVEDLGKLIIRKDDFHGSMDVIPVSDPAIFSEAQRYAQMQAIHQLQVQDAQDPSIPWNKVAIRRRALKQLRIDNIDELLPLPPKPVTADAMTEIMAILQGQQVVAHPQQDHVAHIQTHMTWLNSPLVIDNPLVQGQPLQVLLGHIQQHLFMAQQTMVTSTAQKILQRMQQSGQKPNSDQALAMAMTYASQSINSTFGNLLKLLPTIQQKVQAKVPPQPMPPEVQASIEIAKMDIGRKSELDKATISMKQQDQEAKQAMELAQQRMDAAQAKFEQYVDQQRLKLEDQTTALRAQVDLMNNKADNEQKQMTELLKNRDDNETKLRIEMQNGFKELQSQLATQRETLTARPTAQPDFTPQIEKLQSMLDAIGKQRTDDALVAVVQGLQATIDTMQRPREVMLKKDNFGKPIGATSTMV